MAIYSKYYGATTFAALSALSSAKEGDVWRISDSFTLGGTSYSAGTYVVCLKDFSSAITPSTTYWQAFTYVEVNLYKVGDATYNSACFPFPFAIAPDYTGDVKIYKASLNSNGTSLNTTEVTGNIPAGEGVILQGTNSTTVRLVPTESAEPIYGNVLHGTLVILSNAELSDKFIFGVADDDTSLVGFFAASSTATLNANRAYVLKTDASSVTINKQTTMATAYIQFTSRLKATSQEGILAEAQQIAVSATDKTDIKTYVDSKVGAVAGSVYRPKGSVTAAQLKALTSAAVGDVYNVTDAVTLGSKTYPAGTNVACLKAFSSAVTPDETYWDALGGFVDLSPYAKSTDLSSAKSDLQTKIDAANSNISTINTKLSGIASGAQVNVIETVKVNGSALAVTSKAVNIDLSDYAKTSALATTNQAVNELKNTVDAIATNFDSYYTKDEVDSGFVPVATYNALAARVTALENLLKLV